MELWKRPTSHPLKDALNSAIGKYLKEIPQPTFPFMITGDSPSQLLLQIDAEIHAEDDPAKLLQQALLILTQENDTYLKYNIALALLHYAHQPKDNLSRPEIINRAIDWVRNELVVAENRPKFGS